MYSLGLVGYPLSHSLSPRLHCAALQAMGLAGDYRLYPVPPLPEGVGILGDLLERLRSRQVIGLNLTIPHKQSVIPYLDELTYVAQAIGAVNTIFMRDGRMIGENTDASGFLVDLERCLAEVKHDHKEKDATMRRAIILGAGGAARAVAYALICSGWEVMIAARRLVQAQALTENLQLTAFKHTPSDIGKHAIAIHLDPLSIFNVDAELIINATPVGMWPEVYSNPWPEEVPFSSGALVYDLVYNPPETTLMRAARQAGLQVANGLGMLIEQAALALETWTNLQVPRESMWQAVPEFSKFASPMISDSQRGSL